MVVTSIRIRKDLKRLAEDEGESLSSIVGDLLENYLCSNSTDKVNEEIAKHELAIKSLLARKKKLAKTKTTKKEMKAMADKAKYELLRRYSQRVKNGASRKGDRSWITGPANRVLVRKAGMNAGEALDYLRKVVLNV